MLWDKNLRSTLEADEYEVNLYDQCVFKKIYKGKQITVKFHADDLLATCVFKEG